MTTKAEQEAVKEALAAIARKNGGLLTPNSVVLEARKKDSVLHDLFEWDEKKAAHAWRIDQARELIRSVKVVIKTERTTITTVAYIRNPDCESDEQGYVDTVSLVGDEERSRTALISEFTRAGSSLRRARELAEVFNMKEEVDVVVESVDVLMTKVEARVEHSNAS